MLLVKPKLKMARISYTVFAFVFVLLLAGCSKNADPQASDSLYWTPPGGEELMPYDPDPLVLQLSVDPVVYISHIPREQELTEDEKNDGVIVMPSTLDDILPRIVAFQGEQNAVGKEAMVMIGGDDRAPCGSILKAIDYAKKAQVKYILFYTPKSQPSGKAFNALNYRGTSQLKYFEFPKGFKPSRELAKNIVTITISKNGALQWRDTDATRENFINEMFKYVRENGPDKILLVIDVDTDAPFSTLRDVLDQARRNGISKVMIAQQQV